MSRIRADKFVNSGATGAPQLTFGAEVVAGVGLTGAGGINITGIATATSFSGNVTGNISGGTVAGSTGTFTGDVDIADQIVHTGDTNTAIRFPAADTFAVVTAGSEAHRVDSSQRLLVGRIASVLDNIGGTGYANLVQIEGAATGSGLAVSNTGGTARVNISRKYTPSNGDDLGYLSFGAEVGSTVERARITCSAEFTNANARGGQLKFSTCADGLHDPTERMRIASDGVAHFNGDVKVLNGDVQMGSGRGINFSASSHATGMTSETLDDYEEGTWTPTIGGTATYTTQEARYTKIGRLVSVSAILIINVKGTGSANTISGFPFTGRPTVSGNPSASGVITTASNLATSVTSLTLYLGSNTTSAIFAGFTGASTSNTNAPTIFQNSTRIDFTMTYEAS